MPKTPEQQKRVCPTCGSDDPRVRSECPDLPGHESHAPPCGLASGGLGAPLWACIDPWHGSFHHPVSEQVGEEKRCPSCGGDADIHHYPCPGFPLAWPSSLPDGDEKRCGGSPGHPRLDPELPGWDGTPGGRCPGCPDCQPASSPSLPSQEANDCLCHLGSRCPVHGESGPSNDAELADYWRARASSAEASLAEARGELERLRDGLERLASEWGQQGEEMDAANKYRYPSTTSYVKALWACSETLRSLLSHPNPEDRA